jgi:hypothetical protein
MKVMDHMHLIVVSETVSDFDPPTLREMDLCIKGCLKPRHAGKELWRKADVLRESSFEVPPAQSMVVRDIGDAKRAPGSEYVRRNFLQAELGLQRTTLPPVGYAGMTRILPRRLAHRERLSKDAPTGL